MTRPPAKGETEGILHAARQAAVVASSARRRPFSPRYHRRTVLTAIRLNLAPMIDMVFLLLLFFLSVSRFTGNEGMLPAHLPARSGAVSMEIPRTPIRVRFIMETDDPDRCSVTIERFNESPLPLADLAEALAKVQQQPGFDANTPVHLMAGDDVRWDHVVNAYNAALAARYEKVYFAAPR